MQTIILSLLCLLSLIATAQNDRPNILWITNEDTSPSWGCYGDAYASTPNIDALAESGFRFTRAYSNAPICAPARSTLITGMYATSLGTQHLRSEIPVPSNLRILPEMLKEAGYYTTNNSKTDYNFSADGRWDENGASAHWRNRSAGTPFFSVFNLTMTHEGNTNSFNTSLTDRLDNHHDPASAILPPYFPDTEKFRQLWAHAYDLVSAFDEEVGNLMSQLKADGELENTIIFIFSDHGWGLPRYKRWLYNSGLQIPFVMHVPGKYRHLVKELDPVEERMVGFVDMAPTVLELAGLPVPQHLQGHSFIRQPSQYTFGYRDRADDCYDMSRSVSNGRYMYIRNYMPHLPYIQNAIIYNRGKAGYEELFRVREQGSLPRPAMEMFQPKPVEELYNLQEDPWQLHNLLEVKDNNYEPVADSLRKILHAWMIRTRDTGLMNEGIMMQMAHKAGKSVYETARDTAFFNIDNALLAAEQTGKANNLSSLPLKSADPVEVYWALVALENMPMDPKTKPALLKLAGSESSVIAAYAARLLIVHFGEQAAYDVLKAALSSSVEPVVLQAAIEVRKLGEDAAPLLPFIKQEIYPRYAGTVWGRYKNWSYPMFIGMALDQTMINCGEDLDISN